MTNKKMIIIDGNSLVYRTFYGIRPMTSKKGIPTNAIYGFANILLNLLEKHKPDYIGVAFDEKKPTFRHDQYEAYKAGRLKMPEELQIQLPLIYKMLDLLDIRRIAIEGFEADDLIGTIAKCYSAEGIDVHIVTGDRDAFQLVDENILVLFTKKGISDVDTMDETEIKNIYGIKPKDLIEVKALMGDKSDNIPGVAGVGEKTALKLIQEYKSIEGVYENIESQKGKLKEKLINDRENAFMSRQLATIITNVPVDFKLEEFITANHKNKEAAQFFNELDILSISNRLGSFEEIIEEKKLESTKKVIDVINTQMLNDILKKASYEGEIYMTWAISNPIYNVRELQGLAIGVQDEIYYFTDQLRIEEFTAFIKELVEDDKIKKIGHNFKDFLVYCMHCNIDMKNINFDSYIAAYLIEPSDSRYDFDDLALKYLNRSMKSKEDLLGKGKNQISFLEVGVQDKRENLIEKLEALLLLHQVLFEKVTELGMQDLLVNIELPLIEVLASFEYQGFKINVEELNRLDKQFDEELIKLTKEIYNFAGKEFNINSPKQLGEILFEELKLPVIKKTKTGNSTNAEVLEKLRQYHPIIEKLLEYRTIAKLSSTYIKGFKGIIEGEKNKIYSFFNQTVTTTGRISSSEPNLQNIPIKLEMGRKIRGIFIPSNEENVLVDADYSQIELRVLAHISGDETLINSFVKGEDIHTRTASEIFNTPLGEVTNLQRGHAKAINFGLIYGKQAFGLAQDLKISRKEAQEYIDMYFGRYPKVEKYMVDIVNNAKEKGYVTSIFGRRRYIPEINSRNKVIVKAGERLALNTPIQGSAADIIKIAMIRVYDELKVRGLESKLILQVHDELIVDTNPNEIDEVSSIVKFEMESATQLSVPLTVDINVGKNWYETK
ncbi:DNA polymerase I [Alkalibaculum sp. M08DMB]|uniref:DNA polymerase I n=1 Tax=Alkalibaculum sporogenes TaxID=2655001 RepID=A0A6A7K576_9FIRM|nr:DNA polymerase I [Alkalibaculum sporogenes]MPW24592.1 DNA polymerase I [Alkalibaculum sporogenes]